MQEKNIGEVIECVCSCFSFRLNKGLRFSERYNPLCCVLFFPDEMDMYYFAVKDDAF